jgi:hypothetical protein
MSGPRKRVLKWIKWIWLIPIVAMPLLVISFHYGFFILSQKNFKILASHTLSNKTELYVVIRKSGNLAEPYLVNFYRMDSEGNWVSYFLADEESYWWGCSLVEDGNNRVAIKAFGEVQAYYDIKSDTMHFAGSRPDPPAVRATPWFLDSQR